MFEQPLTHFHGLHKLVAKLAVKMAHVRLDFISRK
jgi:hypothetical protein